MANADQSSAGSSIGSGSVAERLIFGNRPVLLGLFILITAFLGYNASQIKPDASFERLIPL